MSNAVRFVQIADDWINFDHVARISFEVDLEGECEFYKFYSSCGELIIVYGNRVNPETSERGFVPLVWLSLAKFQILQDVLRDFGFVVGV